MRRMWKETMCAIALLWIPHLYSFEPRRDVREKANENNLVLQLPQLLDGWHSSLHVREHLRTLSLEVATQSI